MVITTLTYILDHGANINNTNNDNENALIIASKNGNLEVIDLLLSRQIDFNHVKNNGDSALTIACKQQNLEIVNRLLAIEGIDVDPVNNEGDTPFLIACQNNYITIIDALLKFKDLINVNVKNIKDDFPLYYAVSFSNEELIKFLLEKKANMYEEKGYGRYTPFLLACSSLSKEKYMKLFIDHGIDINRPNSIGLYPLIQACKSNKINAVKILLQHGANPNLVCDYSTPLIDACMKNDIDIVKELLNYGADVNLKSNNDMTAIIHLVNSDQMKKNSMIRLLIEYGADIFIKDISGNGLLYILKNSNKIDKEKVYETLVTAMKNFDECYYDNDISSFIETYDDYTTVMATLHPNGDNIEEFTKRQLEHAFLQACIFSNSYYAELFLQKCPEIDVNLRETNGDTPLIIAIQLGNSYLIEVLLRYHADPTIVSECHNTALFVAISCYSRHNDLAIIRALLEHGSNPNEICQCSQTALMMACRNELLDVVALLLQYHVDPNVRNSEGHSALSIACMYGNHQIVKLLLDTENINIDNQTNLGDTPLMIACENAFGSVVSLLLKHNANVYLKNHYHQTALHIACSKGLNPIIIQFLKYKKKMDFLDEDDLFLSPYQMLKLNGNTTYLGIVMDYEITYLKTLMCYYNSESTADDFSEKYTYYLSEDEGKKEKDKEKEIEKENNNDNDYDNENNNDNDNNDNNDNNNNDNNDNNDNDNDNNDNDNDFEGENESENDNEERKINSLESKKR
jgi:ankyrin repeat protein